MTPLDNGTAIADVGTPMVRSTRQLRVLYLEPFCSGSHAVFGDILRRGLDAEWTELTLPGRHWKWRMRGAAVHFARSCAAALERRHDVILASSYVALAELRGLAPALASIPTVLYFHENQFAYPARQDDRDDLQYAFTQLLSALVADHCVFNSHYNRDSFLAGAGDLLRRMPDAVPGGWLETVTEKSTVLGLPLDLPELTAADFADVPRGPRRAGGPTILWHHRWEHDKDPETFFATLEQLDQRGVAFRLVVCGERFNRAPPAFARAGETLASHIDHFGFEPDRTDYLKWLRKAQLAVSTSRHEFFGISMLEATHCGAAPLVPDRLAYRELFAASDRYATPAALANELERRCRAWTAGKIDLRRDRTEQAAPHTAQRRLPDYQRLLRQAAQVR